VLHVRSHVDVTDPGLVALDALAEVADSVRDVIGLQLVAFPQEGICSFPDGERLVADAAARGAGAPGTGLRNRVGSSAPGLHGRGSADQIAPIWTAAGIPELDLVAAQNGGDARGTRGTATSWRYGTTASG
jgi:hypothetical protein